MDSVKDRRRKKKKFLILCFRPDVSDGVVSVKQSRTNGVSGDSVIAYNFDSTTANRKIGNVNDVNIPMISSSDETSDVSGEVGVKKRKKRKVSRILKSLLFETSLAKKIRNKKSKKNSFRSSSSISSTTSDKFGNGIHEKSMPGASSSDDENRRINSSISSSLNSNLTSTITTTACSSSSSSIASSSRSTSERKASLRSNSDYPKQKLDVFNYGLCFLLVSLLVLVLWGKVCAIFCTSTWLFFVPRRSMRTGSPEPENGVESPDVDSVEYKKKVIMEGLLGRSRTRMLF